LGTINHFRISEFHLTAGANQQNGILIAAGGFAGATAEAAIAAGHADAIAFGRIFVSNPDLPRRLQRGFPLTPYNRKTFYGGEEAGYTDYLGYDEMAQA
jgi:N-ethylmaleimide reductase